MKPCGTPKALILEADESDPTASFFFKFFGSQDPKTDFKCCEYLLYILYWKYYVMYTLHLYFLLV